MSDNGMKPENINQRVSAVERVRKNSNVDIKTETRGKTQESEKAKLLTADAGQILKPRFDLRHAGYLCVHIYVNPMKPTEVFFVHQTPLDNVNEVQAGLALDDLRRKTMMAFGRQPIGR